MTIREKYVRVQEAAEILGVVPNTVRKWGAAGKIPESSTSGQWLSRLEERRAGGLSATNRVFETQYR